MATTPENTISVRLSAEAQDLQRALQEGKASIEGFSGRAIGSLKDVEAATGSLTTSMESLAQGMKSAFVGSSVAVGIIGLKNTLQELGATLIKTQIQADQLRNTLNFAVGAGKTASEMTFLSDTAKTLGLDLISTSTQYSKLAAASRETSLEGYKTREIFTALSQAATVMGMSSEQAQLSMMAVSQMMSKGKVMAEELRGQLGEHLPGAFNIAARSMGVTTAELDKMLVSGNVIAEDFLPRFARQLTQETAPQVESASQSMQAGVNRMSTSWFLLKQAVNNTGVGENMANQLSIMTDGLNSVSEAMTKSKENGHGMALQLLAATGAVIQFLNPMNIYDYRMQSAAGKTQELTKEAEKAKQQVYEFEQQLKDDPESWWLKTNIRQLKEFIEEAAKAKRAYEQLQKPDPTPDEMQRQDRLLDQQNLKAIDKQRKQDGEALLNIRMKLAGVDEKYVDDLVAISDAQDRGNISEKEALRLMNALAAAQEKATPKDHRADPWNTKMLQDYSKALSDLNKITVDQSAKSDDLSKTQTRLKEIQSDPTWNLYSRQQKEQILYAASLAQAEETRSDIHKILQDQIKETTKAQEASVKAMATEYEGIQKQVTAEEERVAKMGLSTEQLGILRRAELDVGIARLQVAAQTPEIDQVRLTSIELQIAAMQRLKDLSSVADLKQIGLDAIKEQGAAWSSVEQVAHTTWSNIEKDGIGSLKRVGDTLKSSIWDMLYQMTAKRWMISIAASMGGMDAATAAFGSSAVSSVGGSAFGGYLASSGMGAAMGEFGTAALASTQSMLGLTNTAAQFSNALSTGTLAVNNISAYSAATSSLASSIGAAMPYIGAALALYSLATQDHGTPTQGTGQASRTYAPGGSVLGTTAYEPWGGMSKAADENIAALYGAYSKAVSALGIAAASSVTFGWGGNTGKDSQSPNFALSAAAGTRAYSTGETPVSDSAYQIAASRAVLTALQGSQLPKYLESVFNDLNPAAMAQEQITSVMNYATSLTQIRTALLETRTPLQIVTDTMTTMGTSVETFKTDFVAAIDAGIGPDALTKWQNLGNAMDQVGLSSKTAVESIADAYTRLTGTLKTNEQIAQERITLEQQYNQLTDTATQALQRQRDALDASNQALFDQIQTLTKAAAVSEERATLQDQYNQLTLTEVQLRELTRAKLDASNQALYDAINAIKDKTAADQALADAQTKAAATIAQAAQDAAQAAAKAQTELDRIATQRFGLETQLLQLQGNTTALRERELAALDPANRAIQQSIYNLQDAKTAQDAYNTALSTARASVASAQSAFDKAQSDVTALRAEGTDAYLSALGRVNTAQQKITDIQLSAQAEIASAAQASAQRFAELGKTLDEFVAGKTQAPGQNFAALLGKALGGDAAAMSGLTNAASAAQDAAKLQAGSAFDVARIQAQVMADVSRVAQIANAAGASYPGASAAANPLLAAQADLTQANTDLAEALRVANAINAPLQKTQADLITRFADAQIALASATGNLSAANSILDAIEVNTRTTYQNVSTLDSTLAVSVAGMSKSVASAIVLSANATFAPNDPLRSVFEAIQANTKLSSVYMTGFMSSGFTADGSFVGATPIRSNVSAGGAMVDLPGTYQLAYSSREHLATIAANTTAMLALERGSAQTTPTQTSSSASEVLAGAGGYSAQAVINAINQSLASGYSVQDIYAGAQNNFGASASEITRIARAAGIPGFASGGTHSGGWAMVGEQGPELVNLPPARIFNSPDSRSIMGGTDELVKTVKALIEDNRKLREQMAELIAAATATASASVDTAANLRSVKVDGMPVFNSTAEPLHTVAA